MGYMGFGLQRWIYTQRPRKFMSMQRRPLHNEIKGHKVTFLSAVQSSNSDKTYENKVEANKILALFSQFLLAVLILSMSFIIIKYCNHYFQKPNNNSLDYQTMIAKEELREKHRAYNVLTKTGRSLVRKGEYYAAYDDLIRAHKLYPKMIYHQVELANMYSYICKEKNIYCEESVAYKKGLEIYFEGHEYLSRMVD